MTSAGSFKLSVNQNKYLPVDEDEVHAILSVTATELAGTGGTAAEVIVIDCSGSMGYPTTKIANARKATEAAIDVLHDGVMFAVVEGTHEARMVYPANGELAVASQETRKAAKARVRHVVAGGGTAMGAWLRRAGELLDAHPAAVRHVMLLTDGRNESEGPAALDEVLRLCQGKFVCDGRGIGDDYSPEELSRIVSALRGRADAIVDYADLTAEFVAIMRAAQAKVVPDVRLRIRRMPFATVRLVRQRYPTDVELGEWGVPLDDRTVDFSTGSWASGEIREIHVCLSVSRSDVAMEEVLQAAWVDLAVVPPGGTQAEPRGEPVSIVVQWTEDDALSSVLDPKVAHYLGYTELHEAIKSGWTAYQVGAVAQATVAWGRAVALAAKLDHPSMLKRMRRLVDIDGDPGAGVVTVRENLRPHEYYSAYFESRSSSLSRNPETLTEPPESSESGSRCCPACSHEGGSADAFCEECGHKFAESA
jgi:hypothetical protein